jgi:flagellar motor switch protein FliM
LVQIVPPNEVVVLISFELTIGDLRGMINLCIPYNSIERIGGKLSANSWVSYGKRQATPESILQISQKVYTSQVDVNVRLAQTTIGTGELIGLKVGDIITTEKDVHHPLVVSVEGIPKFFANAGSFKGRKAIVIHETIKKPSDALGE